MFLYSEVSVNFMVCILHNIILFSRIMLLDVVLGSCINVRKIQAFTTSIHAVLK
jgi:hypothetical protein